MPLLDVDIAIIGGGAAGLATAIFAARRAPDRSIVVLDGAKKLGAKILVSGGGRCNVTNAVVRPADYWGGSPNVIKRVLNAFPVAQTIAFFRELGVPMHEEPNGKLFPDSNSARTILDALLREAARLNVRILTEHRVNAIDAEGGQDARPPKEANVSAATFKLQTSQGPLSARKAVLATGGQSLPKTGSDGHGYQLARSLGHSIVPTTPALAPLVLDGHFHAGLTGIAQDVELTVKVEGAKPVRLTGAMLWTHFGVSGPVAMNASRHWHRARLESKPVHISANMLPGKTFESLDARLIALAAQQPKTVLHNALSSLQVSGSQARPASPGVAQTALPARVAVAILEHLGIGTQIPLAHLGRDQRRKLVHALLEWPLPVRDSRGYSFAEATAGGVSLNEIDPATMESRKCPGLFLVGEVLDVDGRIGGFNFQWAWSSAKVAAEGLTG
ncbi:MAG TPA: NAD(P)/FAD-dependent oxidoreductase [Phycisphaerae bacterium]|jgi:predicted Rossmann fold flavoprotein|nr:NAD(P)/FAD-dependent oxidoreductase [Phycisphaerae bacterium]HOB76438.1 NAD(P)/FAD-dependent oxidoreductase [Phycisphaerae bacterium]HOJ56720.1 NAD(P)/FAD-dependent oxidoreductase [Phycisphaerae bacterium]HOL28484.1 NAD(P)/FAD-dependent oxidoreductase [Phycisphaerae bacterium]HPP22998.1 NAD(P)/FAD-dependent oxidoreductase [Phycisphaerae bacterium]